ncbi:hypothetical protein VW29_06420 [Devosia limi DSM 17137]|uniref:Uncharacterized conserved protein n=1 Tax=Devosia limi DSM 17137 TaxID=1121477 RepID=A0A0F5LVI5_9HYPH|nr:hypothetical protein [Devosia limi]KKB85652.1 hypothetical protein VW29_06420 [Devosia limi DSM 17137]SHF17055.1 Uncharacterized conserved protein [Devosia limi DSM 17137]
MADEKSGPVKPPVLDLKARPAAAKPASKPDTAKPDAAKPDTTKSESLQSEAPKREKPAAASAAAKPAEPAKPNESAAGAKTPPVAAERPFPVLAMLGGGVIGLAAAYGLAWAGLWPSAPAAPLPADPRLARFEAAIPELQTVTETTQSEMAALNQRIGALETAGSAADAMAPAPAVDISAVEAEIAALAARLDGLSSAAPVQSGVEELAALRTEMSGLSSRIEELGARLGTTEASVRTLDTSVADTKAALAEQPADIGAVLQLPLVLSGFEAAFASGRPYEAELAALRSAVPDAVVPTIIANGAATGLPRADAIAARFAQVVPAMLAMRPANPDSDWQGTVTDWFRSMIALRPTGAVEGDDPEAVVARLEAAIGRRDFATAETLLGSLPAPMASAAADVPAMIAAQAEAGRFLDSLRASALAGSSGSVGATP